MVVGIMRYMGIAEVFRAVVGDKMRHFYIICTSVMSKILSVPSLYDSAMPKVPCNARIAALDPSMMSKYLADLTVFSIRCVQLFVFKIVCVQLSGVQLSGVQLSVF
jgi:hypothetical protein